MFDAEGDFGRAFGREGQGPGELQGPITVRVRDGIATVRGRRKSRFRTDGTFIDLITHEGGGDVDLADNGTRVIRTCHQEQDRAAVADRYDRLIVRNMEYGASESLREQLLGMKASAQYAEHKGFWWLVEAEEPGGWIWLTIPAPRFGVYYRDVPPGGR